MSYRSAFLSVIVFLLLSPFAWAEGETPDPDPISPATQADKLDSPGGNRKIQVTRRYLIDLRVMKSSVATKLELMSAEMDLSGSIGDRMDFALQVPFTSSMQGRAWGMHYGNAYVILKGQVGKPTLKLGQFVVPFGNLVDYETHTRIFQTLYRYSLGERIDLGAELEGYLGKNEWQAAVTTGNGPYKLDNNGNKVITLRIAHKYELGEDELRVGLSGLYGRLPVFPIMFDPLMETKEAEAGMSFAKKTRFALDMEYYRGIDLIRLEAVGGTDDGKPVNGQWAQIEHPLSYSTSLFGFGERWQQRDGTRWGVGLGVERKLASNATARLAYEIHRSRDNEMGMSMNDKMLTGQYVIQF